MKENCIVIQTFEKLPTLYFSSVGTYLAPLIISNKTVIFVNDSMIYGIVSSLEHLDYEKLKVLLKEDQAPGDDIDKKFIVKKGLQASKGKEKIKNDNGVQINYNGKKIGRAHV